MLSRPRAGSVRIFSMMFPSDAVSPRWDTHMLWRANPPGARMIPKEKKPRFSDPMTRPLKMDGSHSTSGELPQGGRPEPGLTLSEKDRKILRDLARESIRLGLRRPVFSRRKELGVDLDLYSPALREPGAAFVTLKVEGRLRGCIGTLEPRRSLVEDVVFNARAAAFEDRRFAPLSESEFVRLEVHVSVLTPLVPLEVESREDLLGMLRPGRDGLLLEDPPHRSTFLPQVWESLPDPEDFLGELLLKGGLARDHWSPTIRFHRYSVEEG
jgi:AmmeMemoRadiSam system protein A